MNKNLRALTECGVMIALATVLSIIKIAEMPYGGSITVASMLPIAVAVFRHGGKWGLGVSAVTALVQMLLGMKNFSYFTTWQSIVAIALLDYLIAFTVFSLSGVFKKAVKRQNLALTLGVILASVLRYACHVISGATVWAGLSIPTEAALVYSISYNATYMLPETIVLAVATFYLASVIDFTRPTPQRIAMQRFDRTTAYSYMGAGLAVLSAVIIDVATVFPHLQDPNSGEFVFANIKNANFTVVIITSGIALFVAAGLVIFAKAMRKNKN